MDSLTVTHLTLAPCVVEKLGVDRHELSFEEISQFHAHFTHSLVEVERLRKIGWHIELEWIG